MHLFRTPAAVLQIDLGAIRDDWRLLGAQAVPGIRCAAVVKADAHGLGAVRVASALYGARCRHFFVALVDEAIFEMVRRRWPGLPCGLANSSGVFLGADFNHRLLIPDAASYGVAPTGGRPNPMRRGGGSAGAADSVARGPGQRRCGLTTRGAPSGASAWSPFRRATPTVGCGPRAPGSTELERRRRALVGRVSMDTVTVDVSALPADALVPGAAFDLIVEASDINAVAAETGTGACEILSSSGPRYHRSYITP